MAQAFVSSLSIHKFHRQTLVSYWHMSHTVIFFFETKELKQHFLSVKNAQFRDNSPLMGRGSAHFNSFGTGCPASQPQLYFWCSWDGFRNKKLRQQPSIMSKNMRLFATSKDLKGPTSGLTLDGWNPVNNEINLDEPPFSTGAGFLPPYGVEPFGNQVTTGRKFSSCRSRRNLSVSSASLKARGDPGTMEQ